MIRRCVFFALMIVMLWSCVPVLTAEEPAVKEPPGQTKTTVVEIGASAKMETTPSEPAEQTGLPEALEQTKPKMEWSLNAAKLFWSVVMIVLAYYAIAFVSRILERIAERWVNLRLAVMRLIPFIRVLGWTGVVYMIVAGILAPPIETLLALTASAGIALGFSSQDILKNMFGGMMILMDRPFQVGDKIQLGSLRRGASDRAKVCAHCDSRRFGGVHSQQRYRQPAGIERQQR
jgi:hypothetical protein